MTRKIEAFNVKNFSSTPSFELVADVAMVPVSDLVIDGDYQRDIRKTGLSVIRKIAADFSWGRFGCLIVCRHGKDSFKVIDGQHRAIAAASIGVKAVPCIVLKGNFEKSDEAANFIGINTARTALHSIDKFRAMVVAGDEVAVAADGALKSLGVSLVHNNGNDLAHNETRAANAILNIARKHGAGILFSALELLMDAFPGEANILNAFSMKFSAELILRCIEEGDDLNDVLEALKQIDLASLSAEASSIVRMMGGSKVRAAIKIFDRSRKKMKAVKA